MYVAQSVNGNDQFKMIFGTDPLEKEDQTCSQAGLDGETELSAPHIKYETEIGLATAELDSMHPQSSPGLDSLPCIEESNPNPHSISPKFLQHEVPSRFGRQEFTILHSSASPNSKSFLENEPDIEDSFDFTKSLRSLVTVVSEPKKELLGCRVMGCHNKEILSRTGNGNWT